MLLFCRAVLEIQCSKVSDCKLTTDHLLSTHLDRQVHAAENILRGERTNLAAREKQTPRV